MLATALTILRICDAARDTMCLLKPRYFTTLTSVPSTPKTILAAIGVVAYIALMYVSAIGPDAAARTVVLTVLAWQGFAVAILWRSGKRARKHRAQQRWPQNESGHHFAHRARLSQLARGDIGQTRGNNNDNKL